MWIKSKIVKNYENYENKIDNGQWKPTSSTHSGLDSKSQQKSKFKK